MKNMEKTPQFIKKFSKEESADERAEAARAIKSKRAEHFDREASVEEKVTQLATLEERITALSDTGLKKLWNYFEIKKLNAEKSIGQHGYDELLEARKESYREGKFRTQEKVPAEFADAKYLLKEFYKKQKDKWETTPVSREDIERHFTEENLASLSLPEYQLLLNRFPNKMVAHVVRQGIRDHIGHLEHQAGLGEVANGFKNIVKDGRLRSPLGVYLVSEQKEKAVADYLGLDAITSKEEARNRVQEMANHEKQGQGSYADKAAVHFAAEEVADAYYGSERGNEIFLAYPSAFIAQLYYFEGNIESGGSDKWNDVWVWANEERGLDVDAAIIFLPADAAVDPATGSRYKIDEEGKAIKNAKYIEGASRFVQASNFLEMAQEIRTIGFTLQFQHHEPQKEYELNSFRDRLQTQYGIVDHRLQNALCDASFLRTRQIYRELEEQGKPDPGQSAQEHIRNVLKQAGIYYEEAEQTISSQEYWEAYFEEHPDEQPSKIVYYTGGNPTAALQNWKEYSGAKRNKILDFFPDKKVSSSSPQATAGMDRFQSLAKKVIDDYFSTKV